MSLKKNQKQEAIAKVVGAKHLRFGNCKRSDVDAPSERPCPFACLCLVRGHRQRPISARSGAGQEMAFDPDPITAVRL